MKNALLFCVLLAVAGISGCDTTYLEHDPEKLGLDYYPIQKGDYKIYKVVDIKYQHNIATKDSFEMREVVDTTFVDQTNTLNYKIVRSIKRYGQSEWVDDSVMTVAKSDQYVLLTKDNTKYLKMIFPVKEGKLWYGDAYNDRVNSNDTKEPYVYQSVGEPFILNGTTYPSTLTVDQGVSDGNVILIDDRREVYAKGIGKIYRIFNRVVISSCTPEPGGCPNGENYKINGHERHETLIEHGNR